MVRVILTDDPNDRGETTVGAQVDCACDCDCACPVGQEPTPVLSTPVAYYLELTPACQNRCPGCGNVYAADRLSPVLLRSPSVPQSKLPNTAPVILRSGSDEESPPPPLNGDAWRVLLARLAPHTHHLKLTGGEPTLHPDFAAIVRAIDGHGIPFALFSNGRWSDPGALLRLLRETPICDGLLISLHGPDARTHEAFTGVAGSFAETAANVRRAVDAGLDVATSLVITRHNWDRVEETLALALELGANHVVCNRWIGASANAGVMEAIGPTNESVILRSASDEESLATIPHRLHARESSLPSWDLRTGPPAPPECGPQNDILVPSEDQLRAAISTVEALRAAGRPIRFGNCIPQCYTPSSSTGCTAGSTFATIDPWGRMRPCNHAPWVAGDLLHQSLQAVWQGPVMEAWRALVPEGCAGCAAYVRCHGGCRAQGVLVGQKCDLLIRETLATAPTEPEELRLYGGLRPVGRYVRRDEGGRNVLIYKSKVVLASPNRQDLWSDIKGIQTLYEIEGQYDVSVLASVVALHFRGMIAWANDAWTV